MRRPYSAARPPISAAIAGATSMFSAYGTVRPFAIPGPRMTKGKSQLARLAVSISPRPSWPASEVRSHPGAVRLGAGAHSLLRPRSDQDQSSASQANPRADQVPTVGLAPLDHPHRSERGGDEDAAVGRVGPACGHSVDERRIQANAARDASPGTSHQRGCPRRK